MSRWLRKNGEHGEGEPHRKRVKHYHQPGDFHELTFSCYRRQPLLTNHQWRRWLAESIDDAVKSHEFHLNVFVLIRAMGTLALNEGVRVSPMESPVPGLRIVGQPLSSLPLVANSQRRGGTGE